MLNQSTYQVNGSVVMVLQTCQEFIELEPTSQPTTPTKPKKERKWQTIWQTEFKWLERQTQPDGDQRFCSWCRDG